MLLSGPLNPTQLCDSFSACTLSRQRLILLLLVNALASGRHWGCPATAVHEISVAMSTCGDGMLDIRFLRGNQRFGMCVTTTLTPIGAHIRAGFWKLTFIRVPQKLQMPRLWLQVHDQKNSTLCQECWRAEHRKDSDHIRPDQDTVCEDNEDEVTSEAERECLPQAKWPHQISVCRDPLPAHLPQVPQRQSSGACLLLLKPKGCLAPHDWAAKHPEAHPVDQQLGVRA